MWSKSVTEWQKSVIQCTLLNALGPLRKWNISVHSFHTSCRPGMPTQIGGKWALILHIILLLVPLFIPMLHFILKCFFSTSCQSGHLNLTSLCWKGGRGMHPSNALPADLGTLIPHPYEGHIKCGKWAKEVHTCRCADEVERKVT